MKRDLKALIVDDDKNFLALFEKALMEKGCAADAACDAEEALKLALNHIYHVVFIDCILIGRQGLDLAAQLRKALGSSVEIVIISGFISQEDISDFPGAHFLKKPVSSILLEKTLSQVRKFHSVASADSLFEVVGSPKFSPDDF